MTERPWLLAYDLETRQVGCVLIQAAMGGNVPTGVLQRIEPWALAPTPGMKVYCLSQDDLDRLVEHSTVARQAGKR